MRVTRIPLLALVGVVGTLLCLDAAAILQIPTAGPSSRQTTAVTYEARRTTNIDLVGTPLLPRTSGRAEIKTESSGPVRIKARARGLTTASRFGQEYLTFVLWAIPPQGRAKNLGELRVDDGEAEIEATADVQTFALIVTAEPYYAVTTPSEVVVMENLVTDETRGRTSIATLEYEIVPSGGYIPKGARFSPAPLNAREPVDVQQARNAVTIAQLAEAGRFAPQALSTAERQLGQVEALVARRQSSRDIVSQARAVVQAAEEARLQSARARAAEAEHVAREEAAKREQAARDEAAREAVARQAAEQERQRAEAAARAAAQGQERAQRLAEEAARDREAADAARREAEKARSEAEAQAAAADAQRAKSEQDQVALRATLLRQFNDILETQDTARGLIVNIGDVLFETGRHELAASAREKLARFAGLVLAHPGLAIQAEGFTDSTGTLEVNDRLSLQRADAVTQFLMAQGLPRDRITARGYGASFPVASNDTREGRQRNRRVELVVTGEIIGTPIAEVRR
jgi:outer membrane protein OmpA-like peptidoglycan-associated protein